MPGGTFDALVLGRSFPLRLGKKQVALPAQAPFGEAIIDAAACTLCMACVGACPGRALQDGSNREVPEVFFIESNCLQCGACVQTCPEDAVRLAPRLLFDSEIRNRARALNRDTPFACISCGKPFAAALKLGEGFKVEFDFADGPRQDAAPDRAGDTAAERRAAAPAEERPALEHLTCPKCGQGRIIEGRRGFGWGRGQGGPTNSGSAIPAGSLEAPSDTAGSSPGSGSSGARSSSSGSGSTARPRGATDDSASRSSAAIDRFS